MKPINLYECDNLHCLNCDFLTDDYPMYGFCNKIFCEQRKIFQAMLENDKKLYKRKNR